MKEKRLSYDWFRSRRFCLVARAFALIALAIGINTCSASAQESVRTLSERSSIVLRGNVMRINASEEPLQSASAGTVVVKVTRMFAGSEIAGDQTGLMVTVILRAGGKLKVGSDALFFGNPRFVGKSLTMVDEGELASSNLRSGAAELEVGLQARRDEPVRQRLATASKVFRGKVEDVRPLPNDTSQKDRFDLPTEHDPEWQVATVRVTDPLRGAESNSLVMVIFPGSRDITWFNSPKLQPGQEAIFITQKPTREELPLMRATGVLAFIEKQPAELVTHPFDVLPASDLQRVRRLLAKEVK